MTFDILMTIGRLILTMIVVVKITRFRETLNVTERLGLGLMGSGSFLTIGVIWERTGSPFEGWAASVLTYGAIAFLMGRTWRDWKHERANQAMIQMHAKWKHDRSAG